MDHSACYNCAARLIWFGRGCTVGSSWSEASRNTDGNLYSVFQSKCHLLGTVVFWVHRIFLLYRLLERERERLYIEIYYVLQMHV